MFHQLEEFIYPDTLGHAVQKKEEYGEAGAAIAGGTEIVANLPPAIRCLIDVTRLGLNYIREESGYVCIGATTTMHDIAVSPTVARFANGVLSTSCCQGWPRQIRNTATLGGNLVGAGPFADSPPALLALEAEAVIARTTGEETVGLDRFFLDYRRTAVGNGILKEIRFPAPRPQVRGAFLKFSRSEVDQALVNVAVCLELDQGVCQRVRIALGAVDRTPRRLLPAERALQGKPLQHEAIENVASIVRELIDPLIDFRASADYRREIAGMLTRRALLQIAS